MKKLLYSTTAIIAAGFASTATAAEWETTVGGYMFLGLATSDSPSQDDIGVLRDGEIIFDGRLTADNGLVFAAHVELEAYTTGDQIDENWGAVRGSFGRIKIGGDDDAQYAYNVGTIYAPGGRIGYYDQFGLTQAAGVGFQFYTRPGRGLDDVGIHYDSPNFSGFQIGLSYIPDTNTDGANDTQNAAYSNQDFYAIGAQYKGEFGDFGYGLSGGYSDRDGSNNEIITVGANASFAGFTVAGTFEDDIGGDEYAIGAQYATGPWTIAGGYTDSESASRFPDPGTPIDVQIAAGWVTYLVAPGVSLTAGVEYAEDNQANQKDFGGLAYMSLRF